MSNELMRLVDKVELTINQCEASFKAKLSDAALSWEQEAGFAVQILTASEYAMKVAVNDPRSLANAITNVASIGISLNPARKQAYLVPRDNRICLDISYMGLMDLATRTGSIVFAQAHIVYAADQFQLRGVDQAPIHQRDPFAKDRGAALGGYCVAKLPTGEYLTHTMSIDAIHAIRDRSSAWRAWISKKKSCPWVTDFEEMAKKTVVKPASKYWPENQRLKEAIHHLNTDGGEGIVLAGDTVEGEVRELPFDFEAIVAELKQTSTDAAAMEFWREKRVHMREYPDYLDRFKQEAAQHRLDIKARAAAATQKEEA